MCCSALQCDAVRYNTLRHVAVFYSVLHCVAVCCSVLQCAAVRCSALQCVAVCCNALQCIAVRWEAVYASLEGVDESYVGHHSFRCGTLFIHMWDMTHSDVGHDSFIENRDRRPLAGTGHDIFICGT